MNAAGGPHPIERRTVLDELLTIQRRLDLVIRALIAARAQRAPIVAPRKLP